MLAAVAAIALFTALGFWQLGRAEFKRDLAADYERADSADAVAVDRATELASLPRFTPVRVTGRFDTERQIFLDNRVRDARPGIEVFTPLALSGGGAVLVNRGWLPVPDRRRPLPDAPAPREALTLRGLVNEPPATGLRLGDAPASPRWPWLTPYLAIPEAEAALDRELADRVVLLGESEPYGFERGWEPRTLSPERHVGYAVQWFALAAAVAVTWLVLGWRSRRRGERA